MLFMLMFLGLLPATMVGMGATHDDDSAGGAPGHGGGGGPMVPLDTALDTAPGPAGHAPPDDLPGVDAPDDALPDEPDPGAPAGETITLDEDSGDVSIAGFRPGVDHVTVALAPGETRFEATAGEDDEGAALTILGPDDDRMILFPGLSEVPISDLAFLRTDPETGMTTTFALHETTEVLLPLPTDGEDAVVPAEDSEEALLPSDPEAEDQITPGAGEDPLLPLPPDLEDTPVAATPDLELVPTGAGGADPEPPEGPDPQAKAA